MTDKPIAPATEPVAAQSASIKLKSIESVFNKDVKRIREVVNNYKSNLDKFNSDKPDIKKCLSIITEMGGFPLETLRNFLEDVSKFHALNKTDPKMEGIGIYLFREKTDQGNYLLHSSEHPLVEAGNNLTQVSFVLAPIEVGNGDIERHFIDEDIEVIDGDVEKIPAMIPGNEGTGLCPPSCSPR